VHPTLQPTLATSSGTSHRARYLYRSTSPSHSFFCISSFSVAASLCKRKIALPLRAWTGVPHLSHDSTRGPAGFNLIGNDLAVIHLSRAARRRPCLGTHHHTSTASQSTAYSGEPLDSPAGQFTHRHDLYTLPRATKNTGHLGPVDRTASRPGSTLLGAAPARARANNGWSLLPTHGASFRSPPTHPQVPLPFAPPSPVFGLDINTPSPHPPTARGRNTVRGVSSTRSPISSKPPNPRCHRSQVSQPGSTSANILLVLISRCGPDSSPFCALSSTPRPSRGQGETPPCPGRLEIATPF